MYPTPPGRASRPSAGRPPANRYGTPSQRPRQSSAVRSQDDTQLLRRVDVDLDDYLDSIRSSRPGNADRTPRPSRSGDAAPPEPEPLPRRRTEAALARVVAAVASLGAAAIHIGATPAHWQEWRLAGAFFAGTAAFQLLWGLLALRFGNAFIRVAGLIVNLGILGVWALSRWQGMPFGPAAGVPEAVGAADLIAAALQIAVVVGLAWSLLPRERVGVVSTPGFASMVVLALLVFGAVAGIGTVKALTHEHSHDHGTETGDDGHSHDHGVEEATETAEPTDEAEPTEAESPAEEEDHTHAPGEEHD